VLQPGGGSCHAEEPSPDTPHTSATFAEALEGEAFGTVKVKDTCSRFFPPLGLIGAAAEAQNPTCVPATACPHVVMISSGSVKTLDMFREFSCAAADQSMGV
jgi:hypothetical protein